MPAVSPLESAGMEDTNQNEIVRLRRIIAKLEQQKRTRIITVEIVPREDKSGYLVYVTAPTAANEAEFGIAIYHAVATGFRRIGVQMDREFVNTKQAAPPRGNA